MLVDYGYIGLFTLLAIAFSLTMILIPAALRLIGVIPRHPTAVKIATYECGLETIGKTWVQFNIRYYFYALLFVALDVLVVFVYPWAVELRRLGITAFVAIVVLIAVILVGYLYAWKKKVLEWK